jgi:hypothetical protein
MVEKDLRRFKEDEDFNPLQLSSTLFNPLQPPSTHNFITSILHKHRKSFKFA